MSIQLRDLEYFAAIAEHGQLQRAAEALGLTQPALSKSLRRLELAVDAQLLRRTLKGVELTSVGSALLARVSRVRLSLDDVTREVADLREGRAGHLRIGMAGVLAHIVPVVCAKLLKEAPRLTLRLTSDDHAALLDDLLKGALDIAVSGGVATPHEDLTGACLYEEEAVTIYAAAEHRLAKRRQVTLADIAQERWALPPANAGGTADLLTQVFNNLGLPPPKIVVEAPIMMARFRLVAASDLLTYGTKSVAEHSAGHLGIVELRLKGLSGTRRVGVRYRKDAYLPPVAFRFIEMLKKSTTEVQSRNR
jgi:DNA-binding transcriptional LysR family regulator